MWRWMGVGAMLVAVGGCAEGKPITAAFDPAAAAFIDKKGTGEIDGQAFLRRDYGYLVSAAGERVFLIPATAYAVQRFESMFGGDLRAYWGYDVPSPPEAYYRYRRETKVDKTGRFKFTGVAPGRYIVATRVFWTEPKSYLTRGGAIYDIVEVRDGETATAVISGK